MFEQEKYNVEYKGTVVTTFLKTVSAYANYNSGKIIFGVDDSGVVIGLDEIKANLLRIENMINDSITPRPVYKLNVEVGENPTRYRHCELNLSQNT